METGENMLIDLSWKATKEYSAFFYNEGNWLRTNPNFPHFFLGR